MDRIIILSIGFIRAVKKSMLMPILLADVIGGPVLFLYGGLAALVLLAAVVIIETPALVLMRWQSFPASLRDVLIVNLVSMAAGFMMVAVLDYLGPIPVVVGVLSSLYGVLVISWLLSIVVEGWVLMLLRRESARRSFMASLVMNTASYMVLALMSALFYLLVGYWR